MMEIRFRQVSFRGEVAGKVKDLAGFSRQHRVPEDHGPGARRFIRVAGTADVGGRAEILFDRLRRAFRYKRKEITVALDEGSASIATPDFDIAMNLEQDDEIAAGYRLVTELSGFRCIEVIDTREFAEVFDSYCDTIVVAFDDPLRLEKLIDRIEENDDLAAGLDYDAACSWLRLRLPALVVEARSRQMIFRLPAPGALAQLIANTRAAFARLADGGIVPRALEKRP